MSRVRRRLRRYGALLLHLRYLILPPLVVLMVILPVSVQFTVVGQGDVASLEKACRGIELLLPVFAIWWPAFALRAGIETAEWELFRGYTGSRGAQLGFVLFCDGLYLLLAAGLYSWLAGQFPEIGALVWIHFLRECLLVLAFSGLFYALAYGLRSAIFSLVLLFAYRLLSGAIWQLPSWLDLCGGPAGLETSLFTGRYAAILALIVAAFAQGWYLDRHFEGSAGRERGRG